MFGGFGSLPRKPGSAPQKPLGVISGPVALPEPPKPLEAYQTASVAPRQAQRPLGVIPLGGEAPRPPARPRSTQDACEVEAVWNGIIHGWSGYSKANRELLKRVSAYARIRFADDAYFDPLERDPGHLALHQFHKSVHVSQKAPRITFLPPPPQDNSSGYKIIYTMIETDPKVHPQMIARMNERYEECWTPTRWNAEVFINSGLRMPVYVMPLGVDPAVYHPSVQPFIPKAVLMTGPNAGRSEFPRGFLFINVFQPSFRKGHDVLIEVFEETFSKDPEVGLILGTTASSLQGQFPWKSMRSRIWTLPGGYSEAQMASIYKGCQAYVTASRAEGWNLPLGEAGAVGLPVICGRVTSHPEVVPKDCGYFFEKDGTCLFPKSEQVSEWFGDGMLFAEYGQKSRKQLSKLMLEVRKNYASSLVIGKRYSAHVSSKMTWSITARKIAQRLRSICARP